MPFVSRKQLEEFRAVATALKAELDAIKDRPFLIDIQRQGRVTNFTFSRNNEVYKIETMSMLSDNLPEWRDKLLR